jgi:predicted homoserine dehydrogenase-like protein
MDKPKIGIVGTGFIATGLAKFLQNHQDFQISKVLTRRPLETVNTLPSHFFTNSTQELTDSSDIIIECSGDVLHATNVILEATSCNKKVLTINSEFHVTTGSYFAKKGFYVTEADGDQPGCLARLKIEIEGMGFEPAAYVNLKGFLNPNPTEEEMLYWSNKQNLSLDQTISFTDGTKLQIEQAFVANGLGATIGLNGIEGRTVERLEDLDYLVDMATELGQPVSDYVLCKGSPPGVLIVAKNKEMDRIPGYLPFSRLATTNCSAYVLLRPYHLTFLEAISTIKQVVNGAPVLLNNSAEPTITVASIAKRKIRRGDIIKRGAGGFDVRGHAVRIADYPDAVPVCLLKNSRVIRDIEPGAVVKFDDVDMDDSNALRIYQEIVTPRLEKPWLPFDLPSTVKTSSLAAV